MTHPSIRRRLCPASIAMALLGSAASGDLPEYTGMGFVGPTFTERAARRVEALDLDGDGFQDLVALESDGALTWNRDLASRSHWQRLEGFEAMVVTRTGGARLWAVAAGELVEVRATDFEGTTTPAPTGVGFAGLESLVAQDRPGGARLACVDEAGERVAVYAVAGDSLELLLERTATTAQVELYDAALVDWNGSGVDWLAVISKQGLHVYDPAGAEVVFVPGDPMGAFLDVLPGSRVKWGRDLLAYHHRPTPQAPHWIWFANAGHGELLHAQDCGLREVLLADFLAAPLAELVVATGTSRDVWILRQSAVGDEQDPIFEFDPTDVFHVDVSDEGGAIALAPATASADVEGDGDDDVILIDDLGRKIVLTSQRFDEDLLRPEVEATPSVEPTPTGFALEVELGVDLPAGATGYDVEVWFQEDFGSAAAPELLHASFDHPGGASLLSVETVAGTAPVYQLVFRPVADGPPPASYPALILTWTPDPLLEDLVGEGIGASYAWLEAGGNDGGGGTTRDPVTGPPTGGPGGGG